ncbi:MAG: adenylyl-sulfate kinase [Holosporales bacterium]|nr:adenylyl-sulfate kinase [Holosporales bacterium]
MVIWITGFSGAGKTTLARAVDRHLREKRQASPILLDGDEMRRILRTEWELSYEGRRKLAEIYARLARSLSEQGFIVLVATISMFEAVRQWNRQNNAQYLEVYLRISEEERRHRDPKGLYKQRQSMVDLSYEEPLHPDLCFDNRVPLAEQVEHIAQHCSCGDAGNAPSHLSEK